MSYRCFLFSFLSLLSGSLFIIASINLVIDPYGIYQLYCREGLNLVKSEVTNHLRLAKSMTVKLVKPHSLILGSSTAETGIDPNHPAWKVKPVYNLGLSGANIYEVKRYYQHARAQSSINRIVLVLDLFMFNASRENRPDFDENILDVLPNDEMKKIKPLALFSTIFSYDALKASLTTIRNQDGRNAFKANGQLEWNYRIDGVMKIGGYAKAFRHSEKSYKETYFPAPTYSFSFDNKKNNYNSFDSLREIIHMAVTDGSQLTIIISPSHARLLEAFWQLGIWKEFETWKQKIVEIVSEIKGDISVYDFSSCYNITGQSLKNLAPASQNQASYWDGYHFNTAMGNIILDQILDNKPNSICSGVLINNTNINTHLQTQLIAHQRWEIANPIDVGEIQKICQK